MMSTHARLRAESGLKVLEDHLVTLICDLFCRESKASSCFGKAGVLACPGGHQLETIESFITSIRTTLAFILLNERYGCLPLL